jgi:hypothetical protein
MGNKMVKGGLTGGVVKDDAQSVNVGANVNGNECQTTNAGV